MAKKQASTVTFLRTLMGGLACFAAFVLGLFFTFARFGGSGRGQTGLLFNPATQSPKLNRCLERNRAAAPPGVQP